MGRLLLVARLAARDLRGRPAEAVLLLVAITAATATLTLGLVLKGVTDKPFAATRKATAGPDVVAAVFARPDGSFDPAPVKALTGARGVVAHSGPYPVAVTILEANGHTAVAQTEGRDAAPAAVDQPKPARGRWIRDGGVVLEAAFASSLGVGPGDRVTLRPAGLTGPPGRPPSVRARGAGRSFRVVGVAATAAVALYPEPACPTEICLADAGLVWLNRTDAMSLAPDKGSLGWTLDLRLADPAGAPAFVAEQARPASGPAAPAAGDAPFLQSWQDIRAAGAGLVRNERRALLTGSWLLALLAVAGVAVLVGGRMADQMRRVGLLKAVGGTPRLVAAVLIAEYVAVALVAAVAGLAAGWAAAPVLTAPSAGLLGSASTRALGASTIGIVAGVAIAVAVAATAVPAISAARTSTVRALADAARPPRRTGWLIAISARLPAPLLLGLRVAARRPRRTVLAVAGIGITVSGVVAAMAAHADLGAGAGSPRADVLDKVLLAVTVTLVALAAVNTIFITWASALDARHSSALARALGSTPQQVGAGLSAAQVLPALCGALLGIPGGLALIAAVDPDKATPTPPLWQLLAVAPVTVLLVAALTAIPARINARRPVAEVLASELA